MTTLTFDFNKEEVERAGTTTDELLKDMRSYAKECEVEEISYGVFVKDGKDAMAILIGYAVRKSKADIDFLRYLDSWVIDVDGDVEDCKVEMQCCNRMQYQKMITVLKSAKSVKTIDLHKDDMVKLFPEIRRMFDYDQKNDTHQYDLWMHSLHTVIGIPRNVDDDMLYLAALLHDIGKPDSQVTGKREDDTNMHYYGHPKRSMEIVRDKVIPYLVSMGICLSEDEKRRLLYYVEYHDDRVSLRIKHLRRHLNIPVSLKEFQNLMMLQVADAKAHVQLPVIKQRIEICTQLAGEYGVELYERIQKGE